MESGVERSPWLTAASERVYENPWISVREDRVVRPDGEPGIYGVVHYKNVAVGVLPVDDGHTYLVGQYRYPLDEYSWEIPEGGCPEGEEPLHAAQRELREETGLVLDPARLQGPVWRRSAEFDFLGARCRQEEDFFVHRVGAGLVVDDSGWTELERASVSQWRWWDPADLAAAGVTFYPPDLVGLLARLPAVWSGDPVTID